MQPKDIAMTVSTNLKIHLTKVVFFGCTAEDKADFASRCKNAGKAGKAILHPMLAAGIFTEMIRKRHVTLVESSATGMLWQITGLGRQLSVAEPTASGVLLDMWIDMGYLSSCIETWKQQILKMIVHIDELAETDLKGQRELVFQGGRVKERLMDIVVEYDELHRKCSLVTDGASIANEIVSQDLELSSKYLNLLQFFS
jgi:hypothetical protein